MNFQKVIMMAFGFGFQVTIICLSCATACLLAKRIGFAPAKNARLSIQRWLPLGFKLQQSLVFAFFILLSLPNCAEATEGEESASLPDFQKAILPILKEHCLQCHSAEQSQGELDLERFASAGQVMDDVGTWQHVLTQLQIDEMPPKDAKPLSRESKSTLMAWIVQMLDQVAMASAGDPGPVVLRRLSIREYTYSIQDLTGVNTLEPAREFPVDGAAGEGFTNTGAALVMSPALLQKYLDAAKKVAQHAVLLPHGVRFSASDSPADWTEEALNKIREFYSRFSSSGLGAQTVQQGIELDVGTGSGRLPLELYLSRLYMETNDRSEIVLSDKYLQLLQVALTVGHPSVLLDPLREKFKRKQLSAEDIQAWQKVLWKFNSIGHIGRSGGPKSWQESVSPLVEQQELRFKLGGGSGSSQNQSVYLITGNAGDGSDHDSLVWENPRLVAKGRPDLPVAHLTELTAHLAQERNRIIDSTQACLALLSGHSAEVDPALVELWRSYLGLGETRLEPLLTDRLEQVSNYNFIRGWSGANALSVLANASDNSVRIPGVMPPHSVATHPAPDRSSVIAWKSATAANLKVSGSLVHAHPECGNGIGWAVEVRRGSSTQVLASGVSQRATPIQLGPFDDVSVEPGQAIALVISPQDGDHSCDLTTISLTITDGLKVWDLAQEISNDILAGNPNGPWHFLSQSAGAANESDLPAEVIAWRRSPSPELADGVRKYLQEHLTLSHPLLEPAIRAFGSKQSNNDIVSQAPGQHRLEIPSELAKECELVAKVRLADPQKGSVQAWIAGQPTESPRIVAQPDASFVVGRDIESRERLQADIDQFCQLFPVALSYNRIVPVDEVVTLRLYYREDEPLRRLILDPQQVEALDQLWDELLFVAEAPIKQVAAYEQLYQFATQDRPDLVNDFESLRGPIVKAAEDFKHGLPEAEQAQKQAMIALAEKAWRRPLSDEERDELWQYAPRLMLVRVLTSPAFLYRADRTADVTGPVSDWELATRLSYFLWSSYPDETLRSLSADGKLRDPDVLAEQARRMMQDDRVYRLATEFGCQWLHVRDLENLDEKSERHFPTFKSLRADMQQEVARFFTDLIQRDQSVLSILDADHTFVNQALASHYGLQLSREGWHRIDGTQQAGRGGMLGFAAVLAKHSGASRTSAILRGIWVSEVVLGEKLPNPPKGVPVLPDETPEGLSERQLIERHSGDPSCSGCHRRVDPFGFALEGFDAIGRLRQADTKTTLLDGTQVDGLAELRSYLTNQRREDFLRQFSRKLLGYALGRSVQLSDKPLIDSMISTDEHRMGDMIEWIVRSEQFRNVRGRNVEAEN